MSNFVYKKVVENWADIEKEIEKEKAHLTWSEYKGEAEAQKEATQYIHEKYKDVIARLRAQQAERKKNATSH